MSGSPQRRLVIPMRRDDTWKAEYARRKTIGQAVYLNPDIDSFSASAEAFILGLREPYLAQLSSYIGAPVPHGVLAEMRKPGFLARKRGICLRLAAWGWNPFESSKPTRSQEAYQRAREPRQQGASPLPPWRRAGPAQDGR